MDDDEPHPQGDRKRPAAARQAAEIPGEEVGLELAGRRVALWPLARRLACVRQIATVPKWMSGRNTGSSRSRPCPWIAA